MKRIIVLILCFINLYSFSYAGQVFVSYQASDHIYDDDNLWNGRGFYGQGIEAGYSWKYAELGAEYYVSRPKSLFGSTFLDSSIMGTIKAKYPIKRWIPYLVFGVGNQFFTNKSLRNDPNQPDDMWNLAETIHNKNSIALKYGGGIQYAVSKNVSIFGEVSNRYSNTGKGSSLDTYGMSYGGGIRICF